MYISKKDYSLLTGMVQFHFKFSEYIRENVSEDLFHRAIDYAKTYAETDGIQFEYWHENNKKFLSELVALLQKTEARFARLVERVGNKEEAERMWIAKKETSKEDPLGFKNFLKNFVHHARKLSYDDFDQEDWMNFVKLCKYIKDNEKFTEFAKAQLTRVLGSDNDFFKELNNGV